MTVLTQTLLIGSSWVQIADGTTTKTVQVKSGAINVVNADASPAATFSGGHQISSGDNWFTVTSPTQLWARSASTSGDIAEVIIT